MLRTSFNTTTVLPVNSSYTNKKGEQVEQYKTTLLTPVVHKLIPDPAASMPLEQMNAVLKQCAENSQEVEIEFTSNGRDQFGNVNYSIYSVKPLPKKAP